MPDIHSVSEAVESRAKAIWVSPATSTLLIGGIVTCCVRFWYQPPLPGVAIGVLGAGAAIMTFREMHHTHKLLATLAIFALMGIELRDIKKDRADSDAVQSSIREREAKTFDSIGKGIETAIANAKSGFDSTAKGFDKTAKQMNRVADISTENLNQITGGSSYPFLVIGFDGLQVNVDEVSVPSRLAVFGDYALHNVALSLVGPRGWLTSTTNATNQDYGTVAPREEGRVRPSYVLRFSKNDVDPLPFHAFINCSNGSYQQTIVFRERGGKWTYGYSLLRLGHPYRVIRLEKSPGFGAYPDNWAKH